jgi:ADP-ribosylglycohydrolase
MALCIAKSLIEKKGFDPVDQLERYVKWRDEGYMSSTGHYFGSGLTTENAIVEFKATRRPFAAPTDDPRRTGNGVIMRLAPIPMFFYSDPGLAIKMSGESARTTHGAQVCIDAARYFSAIIVGALNGASKMDLLSYHYSPVPDYWVEKPLQDSIARIASGSFKSCTPKTKCSASQTLELALWAFEKTDSFRDGLLKAINLGGDSDTSGAVYGQLGGAFYGEKAIPEEWRKAIAHYELISSTADELYEIAKLRRT